MLSMARLADHSVQRVLPQTTRLSTFCWVCTSVVGSDAPRVLLPLLLHLPPGKSTFSISNHPHCRHPITKAIYHLSPLKLFLQDLCTARRNLRLRKGLYLVQVSMLAESGKSGYKSGFSTSKTLTLDMCGPFLSLSQENFLRFPSLTQNLLNIFKSLSYTHTHTILRVAWVTSQNSCKWKESRTLCVCVWKHVCLQLSFLIRIFTEKAIKGCDSVYQLEMLFTESSEN